MTQDLLNLHVLPNLASKPRNVVGCDFEEVLGTLRHLSSPKGKLSPPAYAA